MTSYFNYFMRALTFKKYPLFRTVNFRYLLYNLIIIAALMILPNALSLLSTVNQVASLSNIDDAIPAFEIVDGEYRGENRTVEVNDLTFIFDERITSDDVSMIESDVVAGFIQDGIYIDNLQNEVLDYFYISNINNQDDLAAFIDTHLSSIYFYYFVYLTLQFFLMIVMVILVLSAVVYALDLVSRVTHKKSRFMNWFKFATFICIILLVPYILIEVLFNQSFYFLLLFSIPFIVHFYRKLPPAKRPGKA